jgi:hypothetical protein
MVLPGKYEGGVGDEGHFQGMACPKVEDLETMRR